MLSEIANIPRAHQPVICLVSLSSSQAVFLKLLSILRAF